MNITNRMNRTKPVWYLSISVTLDLSSLSHSLCSRSPSLTGIHRLSFLVIFFILISISYTYISTVNFLSAGFVRMKTLR
ncbi:hypothetical protein BRARA_F00102 [Brassica rapa]|uniref:Uncharacterized protein n=1 Tax=Brassica campestris TaxID=3711 RepID=A0A397YTC2_BRACM|nr:hypothetical protein BRARA_F00102 [Brassica rapa]